MPEDSPSLPGLESFVPKLRVPIPGNYPGTLVQLAIERSFYMGIVPQSAVTPYSIKNLPREHRLANDALTTARSLMANFKGVFWGCPEGEFSLLVSKERHSDFDSYPRKFTARFDSVGAMCITSSGNVGLALSHSETFSHPVKSGAETNPYSDTLLDLPEGSYAITVTQMFRWKNAQFGNTNPAHLHYHIHTQPLSEFSGSLATEIPWLRFDPTT